MGFLRSLMSVISTDGKTGTPFNLDKNHTVYYKGNGVNKLDAAQVAGYLKGYGYFVDTNQVDVQIFSDKPGSPVKVGFVIGGPSVSEDVETFFQNAAPGLQKYFPNRKLSMHLLNNELKELKQIL